MQLCQREYKGGVEIFDTTARRAMDEGKKRGKLQPSSIPERYLTSLI